MTALRPPLSTYEAMALRLHSNAVLYPKFGQNLDVDAATAPEDIALQGGTYAGFPITNGETVEIFSSSTDDAAAGTGLRTVRIFGLDENWTRQVADVTLNGTTPVTASGIWTRLTFVKALTGGSGMTNAGTITVRHTSTTANVFASMPAGTIPSQIAAFTTEDNYTGIMRNLRVAASNNNQTDQEVRVAVFTREFGSSVWESQRQMIVRTNAPGLDSSDVMLVIPPKTDLKIRATGATADNLRVTARFDMITIQGVY